MMTTLEKMQAFAEHISSIQPDELQAVINELLNDNSRRFELAKNLYGLAKPDAAAKLATIILKAAGSK